MQTDNNNTQMYPYTLPINLTLLVTGTGMRTGMRTNEPSDKVLLLRTEDATLHFDKDSEFWKLAHALVDNYNNYSKLVEENRDLKTSLNHELEVHKEFIALQERESKLVEENERLKKFKNDVENFLLDLGREIIKTDKEWDENFQGMWWKDQIRYLVGY